MNCIVKTCSDLLSLRIIIFFIMQRLSYFTLLFSFCAKFCTSTCMLYVRKIDIEEQKTRKSCFSNKIIYKATFFKKMYGELRIILRFILLEN